MWLIMADWKKTQVSEFLTERAGRYKPNDPAVASLKRLDKIDFSGKMHFSDKSSKTDMIIAKKGDLVISGINVAKGALAVYDGEEDITATIHYSSYQFDDGKIDVEYFKRFLKSPKFIQLLKDQVKGGIKTEIKPKHLLPLKIDLPDLDTQKSIVNFFKRTENDIFEINNEIDHQQSLLKQLRQAVLQEAVEGKLTAEWRKQHPELISGENHAARLLEKIKAEKKRLIKEGKIKKQKPLPPVSDDEKPFDLPEGWVWCIVDDLIKIFLGGYSYKSFLFKKSGLNQVLRLGNIRPNQIRYNIKPVYIDDDLAELTSSFKLFPGDILITMTGTRLKRDYCYTVLLKENHFKNVNLYLNQRVGAFRFLDSVSVEFYNLLLKDDRLLDKIFSTATGSANQANIGSTALKNFVIPLPPLAEQQAIVEKVDRLMAKIDALEEQVIERKSQAEQLMQAVLREAFNGD